MELIRYVLSVTTDLLNNTSLSFGSISFSLMSVFLATAVLAIFINFIISIFDF